MNKLMCAATGVTAAMGAWFDTPMRFGRQLMYRGGHHGGEERDRPDFNNFCAGGVYGINIRRRERERRLRNDEMAIEEDAGEDGVEVESMSLWSFKKGVMGERFVVEAYPIADPEYVPMMGAASERRSGEERSGMVRGPITMFGEGDKVYIITEREEGHERKRGERGDVMCRRMSIRRQKSRDPLAKARNDGLTYENMRLAVQYS